MSASPDNVVPLRAADGAEAVAEVRGAYERLRAAAQREPYPSAAAREERLERLLALVQRERDAIVEATSADFGHRSVTDALQSDVLPVAEAVRYAHRHLREWMKRRPVETVWYSLPGRSWVQPQPLGVVGIIAPWNYPVLLLLGPLASALAAGNRAILKPSELTPRTAALVQRLVRERFSPDEVAVVTGGPEVARAVTQLPVGHLFFTGSTAVGRLVAQAAAERLVPATLELGGKAPAIVHAEYPLDVFAERVALGKLMNAGQTCIAPDYALVPRGSEDRFAQAFTAAVRRQVVDLHGPDVTSLASDRGYARMQALLDDARAKGARVVETLSGASPGDRRMAPVLLFDVRDEMRVMQEEIFGPLLPVVPYGTLEEALAYVNARPSPLTLSYFDDDAQRVEQVLRTTLSGGVCINDTLIQYAQDALPFGGVGSSGMGRAHGQAGFDAFSNLKGVFEQSRLGLTPMVRASPAALLRRGIDLVIGGRRRRPGE